MVAYTPVKIVNMALASFGAGAVQTLSETTPAGAKVALLYPMIIDALLAEYPWSFVKKVLPLTPSAAQPDASGFHRSGWRYAFHLPGERLADPIKYMANPHIAGDALRDFDVFEDSFYCNRAEVWAVVQVRADPDAWPAYFVPAAIACLAAELIMPISGNSGLLAQKQGEAWGTPEENRQGGKLGAAKRADARNLSASLGARFPLIDARA